MTKVVRPAEFFRVNLPDPLKDCPHKFDGRNNDGVCGICGRGPGGKFHFTEPLEEGE